MATKRQRQKLRKLLRDDAPPESDPSGATPAAEGKRGSQARAAAEAAGPVIQIEDLTIEVGGKVLLERAYLTVQQGERILLVGPSGAGKSVLLRLLTGLLEWSEDYTLQGSVKVCGVPLVDGERRVAGRVSEHVGIVFQDHALLDELTVHGNLTFARDHSRSPRAREACEEAEAFLREQGIDSHQRVRTLSGGQKQRVAVARAMARDSQAVFYDEPTSALDPASARNVAELIREAATETTSVVVTHDYPPFQGVATRVILLDPAKRKLREVDFAELDRVMQGPQARSRDKAPAKPNVASRLVGGALRAAGDLLAGTVSLLAFALVAIPASILPVGARPKWFARWFAHYSQLVFLGSAIPYNVIAGAIAGFVATYFTYTFLPRPELTEPLILDDILPGLGFALYRIVVPVLVTLLVAGRTGAALASDFGNRVYHHQIQAMRSLGARPGLYLGTTALWANLVGMLVVTTVAFASASLTSLAVFTAIQEHQTPFYWSSHFWRRIEPLQYGLFGQGYGWVLTKLLSSAVGITLIAYLIGMRPKRSTAEVSKGITCTVYWGTVFVLLVHFVCAFFEFEKFRPPGR